MIPRPPIPTLFPYTTLFRSIDFAQWDGASAFQRGARGHARPTSAPMLNCSSGTRIFVATAPVDLRADRKSTRLNSSHTVISYAVFCLKKKKKETSRILFLDN